MEIAGLNNYYHTDASSTKVSTKYNSHTETSMAEAFKNEVLNWKEKTKEKINKDLENDREKNIMMSEKQWRALLNKVDRAIHNQDVKTDVKVDSSKLNDEYKRIYDDYFAGILQEKEKIEK